jgi:predicted enzyme related to lactoylglutathione lyase
MDWKLELVVVPVTDVDRAKHFYADQLGFDVDVDDGNEHFRIVQLTPPGSGCSIAVGKGLTEAEPGTLKGMQLCVGDIEAARTQLVERGVDVSPIRHTGDGGWFDDPDGNSWTVQESPTLRAALKADKSAASDRSVCGGVG